MPIILYAKLHHKSQIQTTGIKVEHIQDTRTIVLPPHGMLFSIREPGAIIIIVIAYTRCFLVVFATLGPNYFNEID